MVKPVLITRPEQDAAQLASRVAYLGGDPVLCPLLDIRYQDVGIDLEKVQGLLFTSANGVRAFTRLCDRRDIPVFAVGDATAREAQDNGFGTVKAAGGDVDALARLVIDSCDPTAGDLFHAAGSKLAGDLSGLLGAGGFVTRRVTLYDAEKVEDLPQPAQEILAGGKKAAVVFYSPRTAKTFVKLVEKAGLDNSLKHLSAFCLSQAVAEKIAPYQWAKVVVAEKPEQDSLLGQLERILAQDMADEKNQDAQVENEQEEHLTDAVDAEALIEAFGGIRPMANKLDVAVSTVQGWKLRNHIPPARLEDIEKAAAENGIDLSNIVHETEKQAAATDTEVEIDSTAADTQEASATPYSDSREEERPSPSPIAAQAPRPRSGSKVAWAALLASLAVGGALVLQPYWAPTVDSKIQPILQKTAPGLFKQPNQVDPQQPAAIRMDMAEVEALRRQMDGLASAISALETQVSDLPAGGAAEITGTALTRLEEMEKRLSALEGSAPSNGTNAEIASLTERVGHLEAAGEEARADAAQARDALQKALDAQGRETGTLATRVTELSSRLQSVETTLSALADQPGVRNQQEIAMVVAAGQLEVQALDGRPYSDALTTFEALARDLPELDNAIATLKETAGSGVPTRTTLLRDFQKIAARIEKPIKDAGKEDWIDATLANLSGLVSIRRTGTEPDLPPISQAEASLQQDDFEGAVEALAPVTDKRPDIATWLKAAQQRLAVEQAIGELRADAAKRLSLASVTPDNTISRAAGGAVTDTATSTDDTSSDEAAQ